jgi:hypothetical protein
MSYAKRKKWAHEGPSTKEKNDAHDVSCIEKRERRKIAMFQNNKL